MGRQPKQEKDLSIHGRDEATVTRDDFELDIEGDRFSTNHDDRAGRRWQINSDVISEGSDERELEHEIEDDEVERGVFRTRATSTTPQDTDAFGRFTAEEAREHRIGGSTCKRIRSAGVYDDGSRARYDDSRTRNLRRWQSGRA